MDDPRCKTHQKRTPQWWCHLPGPAAWLLQVSQYPCINLFVMGWPRTPSKGFIEYSKLAQKKIISELINFISVFIPSHCNRPQNNGITFLYAPPRLNLLAFLSSIMPACFWLVVVLEILISGLRLQCIFFNCHSICRPKKWYGVCPTRSAQVMRPPQYLSYRKRQLLVGCCVVGPKDGHLRPRPCPSLRLFMGFVVVPQTKDRRVARAHPMHHSINGPIWSTGTKIWVHGGSSHGERGQKPLKDRAAWLMLVVVCCGCALCCGLRYIAVFYPFYRVEHLTHADTFPPF